MPKDTFNNLSDDKKRKIFEAAVQEFSNRRFSEASINQIVKAAGISRGSFYQYFNDKEDIYLYMLEEILKEKRALIIQTEAFNPDADVFETYLHYIRVWGRIKPEYNKIGVLMELDDSEFIAKLRGIMAEGLTEMKEMIDRDKQRGLFKPEIDSELVVDMLYTLTLKYYRAGLDEDMFLKRVNDIIKIIKEGIAND